MEEQRKNSYDPNEDIVDRMWKRSKNSINLVIVVCNILVFLAVTLTGGTESSRHMMDCGAAYAPLIESGEYYRLSRCRKRNQERRRPCNDQRISRIIRRTGSLHKTTCRSRMGGSKMSGRIKWKNRTPETYHYLWCIRSHPVCRWNGSF